MLIQPWAIFVVDLLNVVGEPVAQKVQQVKIHRDLSRVEAGGVFLDLLDETTCLT